MGFLAKILFCIFLRKIIGGMFDSRVTQRPSNFLYSKDEGTSFGNIRDLDQASLMDILRRALGNQNNFEGSGEADSLNTFDINSDKKKTLHTCDTCDDCDSDFVTRVTSSGCVMCHVTVVRDTWGRVTKSRGCTSAPRLTCGAHSYDGRHVHARYGVSAQYAVTCCRGDLCNMDTAWPELPELPDDDDLREEREDREDRDDREDRGDFLPFYEFYDHYEDDSAEASGDG